MMKNTNEKSGNGIESALKRLLNGIARSTEDGEKRTTAVSGLALFKREAPTEPIRGMYEPSICVVVQGAKRVMLGKETYIYDAYRYLLTAVHLPTMVQIVDASPEKPYMGLRLKLDMREVAQMMADSNLPSPRTQQSERGMAVGEMTPPLLDAIRRLVDLLDNEEDIPILAPNIQREIIYRLLIGDQGARLRRMATAGSQSHQIAKAVEWLKQNFREPLRIEDLARRAGMSVSTFHHHFRQTTALSPLQFQKQLRLREARRLLLIGQVDAANAGFQVGYESPSQFSREYSRLFGAPPLRDIKGLQEMSADQVV
ncbi:MAG: hypothetical protein PWQ89_1719, partial [Verrucomicrobiota bacterium]|jgi:AraC-like DNA-binding protein|nr:hypothetical protein [Verrucomicrobiota bacterium]